VAATYPMGEAAGPVELGSAQNDLRVRLQLVEPRLRFGHLGRGLVLELASPLGFRCSSGQNHPEPLV